MDPLGPFTRAIVVSVLSTCEDEDPHIIIYGEGLL